MPLIRWRSLSSKIQATAANETGGMNISVGCSEDSAGRNVDRIQGSKGTELCHRGLGCEKRRHVYERAGTYYRHSSPGSILYIDGPEAYGIWDIPSLEWPRFSPTALLQIWR